MCSNSLCTYHSVGSKLGSLRVSFILPAAAAAAKSLQLCLTLCDPIDGSPPGSAVPGILQARTLEWVAISFSNAWTLEWVAISFSNAWKWKVKVKSFRHVQLFETPWTAAYHAPPSMEFSRQEYWSGLPLPSPSFFLILWQWISFPVSFCPKRPASGDSTCFLALRT